MSADITDAERMAGLYRKILNLETRLKAEKERNGRLVKMNDELRSQVKGLKEQQS